MNDEIQELKDDEQANGADEEAGRKERDNSNWIMGVVLIALGGLFLLGNLLPGSFMTNWWAVFILIPALPGDCAVPTTRE